MAAGRPALSRAQGVAQARAEQEREQAEALLDREAVDQLEAAPEAAEAALGEADHRLALQIVGRTVARLFSSRAFPFHMWDYIEADPAR